MQDEPELGPGFSRQMSLKARQAMLRIDHQNGRLSTPEHEIQAGGHRRTT
jgi:hypothetical protein